jgi:hypothetical protein
MVIRKFRLRTSSVSIATFIFLILFFPITLQAGTDISKTFAFPQSDFAYGNCCSRLLSLSSDKDSLRPDHPLVPKSKGTAVRWSLGATFAPVVIGGLTALSGVSGSGDDDNTAIIFGLGIGSVGLIFGPSAGHFYAHKCGRGWVGAGIRALSGFVVMGGAGATTFSNSGGAIVFVVFGGVIYLSSAIYDIATIGKSVEKYNNKHGLVNLQITPTYSSQEIGVGFGLSLRF